MAENMSYFERIEEKIKALEQRLGRKLTVDEQDELKFKAMQELWLDTASEIAEEEEKSSQ
jgi:hypothetical protein